MNTTPIEKCSLTPDAELTVKLATEKGWSHFSIFPNGNLIGTSPDGIEDERVPDFGRILKDAALELLTALEAFAEPHFMGDHYVRFAPRLIQNARAAIAKAKGE